MEQVKRILVVSRLTQHCRDAVRCGVSLAQRYGAELSVMHLISNPVDMEAVNAPGLFLKEEYKNYRDIQESEREAIDKIIQRVVKGGHPVKVFVKAGDPVKEICDMVKAEKIDLLVILAHEEGRLEHLLFGGDNDVILRKMPCSILMVKKEPEAVHW
jgi:nucleotide-binding universal stress UspA family protein